MKEKETNRESKRNNGGQEERTIKIEEIYECWTRRKESQDIKSESGEREKKKQKVNCDLLECK